MRVAFFVVLLLLVLPSVIAQEVSITLKPIKPIIYINEIAEYNVSIITLNETVSLVAKSPTDFWEISTKDLLDVGPAGLNTILYLKPINTKTGEQIVPVDFKVKDKPFKITKDVAVEIIPDIKVDDFPGITGSMTKEGNFFKAVIRNEKKMFLNDVTLRLLFKTGFSSTNFNLEELEKKILLLNISQDDTLAKATVIINEGGDLYNFNIPIESGINEEIPTVITPIVQGDEGSISETSSNIISSVLHFAKFVFAWLFKFFIYLVVPLAILFLFYTITPRIYSGAEKKITRTSKIFANSTTKTIKNTNDVFVKICSLFKNLSYLFENILLNIFASVILFFLFLVHKFKMNAKKTKDSFSRLSNKITYFTHKTKSDSIHKISNFEPSKLRTSDAHVHLKNFKLPELRIPGVNFPSLDLTFVTKFFRKFFSSLRMPSFDPGFVVIMFKKSMLKMVDGIIFISNNLPRRIFERKYKFHDPLTNQLVKVKSSNLNFYKRIRPIHSNGEKILKVFLTLENLSSHDLRNIRIFDSIPKQHELMSVRDCLKKQIGEVAVLTWENNNLSARSQLKFNYSIKIGKTSNDEQLKRIRTLDLPSAQAVLNIGDKKEKIESNNIQITF